MILWRRARRTLARGVPAITLAAALAVASSGCGSGSGSSADKAASLANLAVLSKAVAVHPTATAEFSPGTSGQDLNAGDQVRTDPKGFAEVTYFDGSWLRVDSGATLTVQELAKRSTGDIVHNGIDAGRAWVKVGKLASGDSNELETPVGVAAVRGTVYSADCTLGNACRFTVLDGTVEVRRPDGSTVTIEAGESDTITKDQPAPAPAAATADELLNDWTGRNLAEDAKHAAPAALPPTVYEATYTVTSSENATAAVGTTYTELWVLPRDCTAPCATQVYEVVNGKTGKFDAQRTADAITADFTRPANCFNDSSLNNISADAEAVYRIDLRRVGDGFEGTVAVTGRSTGPGCANAEIKPFTYSVKAKPKSWTPGAYTAATTTVAEAPAPTTPPRSG